MECCICNNSIKDGFAPEYWSLCSECSNKGFNVCKNDRKVYNKKTINKEEFFLKEVFSFIQGDNMDLLSDVYKQYMSKYAKKKNNICCNGCYNIIYINDCVKYLQSLIDGKQKLNNKRKSGADEKISGSLVNSVQSKIKELENLKLEHM